MPEPQPTVIEDSLTIRTDVLVIGTGIAGLFTAIQASETKNVLLITKDQLMESNTRYAQGGIAAVMAEDDAPAFHLEDTLLAGAGLCDRSAVELLVQEGPARVQDLIRLGAAFDARDGRLELTREGAHSHRRILHANGDSTGYEIVRALSHQVRQHPRITIWEHHVTTELLTNEKECVGAIILRPDGQSIKVYADSTVLCTGGSGQLYEHTTNPEVATADGIALAYRAGAEVRDMEFVQFHPTALCQPGAPRFLISEAVRGEGAILRNRQGEAFMERYHPLRDLAPRDIVARAIVSEMEREQSAFVYLDITHEPEEQLSQRFPTIYRTCLQYDINLAQDWIPVAPAAHYMMGGIRVDSRGESTLSRLFACGEVSSTGIHGANRLASNSLSEAIVYGNRIAERIRELNPVTGNPIQSSIPLNEASEFIHFDDPSNVNKFTTSARQTQTGSAWTYSPASIDYDETKTMEEAHESNHSHSLFPTIPVASLSATNPPLSASLSKGVQVQSREPQLALAHVEPLQEMANQPIEQLKQLPAINDQEVGQLRSQLQYWMTAYAGIRREADSLRQGIQQLKQLQQYMQAFAPASAESRTTRHYIELNNMTTTGLLILQAALHRQESRGGHYRKDFPQRDDQSWCKHTIQHIHNGLTEETNDHV